MKYLIFGKGGWLAGKFKELYGKEAEISLTDVLDLQALMRELKEKQPNVIINAAGKTGKPNIDWCEEHNQETLDVNFYGVQRIHTAIIESIALDNWPLFVHLGSGCVYQGDGQNGKGFKEADAPTPQSFYAKTKWMADRHLISMYRHKSLILRLRLPIDSSQHPRNLLMKLLKYEKIIDDQNSITVIPDFLKAAKELIDGNKTGIYHITNPGSISPAEIMTEYQKLVDPAFQFEIIKNEDLNLQAPRSNCLLNTDRLKDEGIELPPIQERIKEILIKFKNNVSKINEGKSEKTSNGE